MHQNPLTLRRWLRTERIGRRFDYDRRLLPNQHLRRLEPSEPMPELEPTDGAVPAQAQQEAHYVAFSRSLGETGMSMGYPAWNLLYYSMICSLVPTQADPVVVETGTNRGLSTIVMAQALKDLRLAAVVETVELDQELSDIAGRHVEAAGLAEFVKIHTGDSIDFLTHLVERVAHIDFLLLDDAHDRAHVERQMNIVCPKVAVRRGKIYFDNSGAGGVAEALPHLLNSHGGNLVEFENCSMCPSGNAIWQAS